jgi:hypothetical protein
MESTSNISMNLLGALMGSRSFGGRKSRSRWTG